LPAYSGTMRKVYFGTDNIITSLGFTTEENAGNIRAGISGIKVLEDKSLLPFPAAYSAINQAELEKRFADALTTSRISSSENNFTRLEKMFITSISSALQNSQVDPADPRTLMVFSTTKGNIDNIEHRPSTIDNRQSTILLWEMAGYIARLFNCSIVPMIVSNACTSGSVAIMQAARLIASGKYDHAIVTGGDIVSEFVISGFQSFQALSYEACRPFDANRTGLSLGEGCGTVILTSDPAKAFGEKPVCYLGGSTSNDANHISGPSRDGEGLYLAISAAMNEAKVTPENIDFISAHGTATPYNDEMESLALTWAGLEKVPVNSFKGYIGHTLGAAGLIETILSVYSMRNGILFKSVGYTENGVSRPLNIVTENLHLPVKTVLKTASGFGGCNAAIVLKT
jgi:3-oxoacyl-[acyl-carrier-protein] synthase I